MSTVLLNILLILCLHRRRRRLRCGRDGPGLAAGEPDPPAGASRQARRDGRPARREPEPVPVRGADRRHAVGLLVGGLRGANPRPATWLRTWSASGLSALGGRERRHGVDHRGDRLLLDRARRADREAAGPAADRGRRPDAGAAGRLHRADRPTGDLVPRARPPTSRSGCSAATPRPAGRRSPTRRSGPWSGPRPRSATRSGGSWTTSSPPAIAACAR